MRFDLFAEKVFMRASLAVALIVKNEEKHLGRCLESVKDLADEIVVLDSGSTDKTEEIAKRYGAKWFVNSNWQGFGKQRQLAQKYVSSDYVLWLDADEALSPALKKSILEVLKAPKDNVLYKINRLSTVFGKEIRHSSWYPDWIIRLYRCQDTHYNDNLVHEQVLVPEKACVEKLAGDLWHDTYDNLYDYLEKSAFYAKSWGMQRAKEGKKGSLFSACTHALACFFKMYVFKAGFLDGKHGFLLAVLSAHSTFAKYADLWIRQKEGVKR